VTGGGEPVDLAIIGYGPTGMTLAALAGQLGHRVAVFERYTGLYHLPRAACFDDEIMRTFQKLGLVDAVAPGIVAQPDYEWVNAAGETLLEIAYDDPAPAGWAALYMMYQPHIETVLDARCQALPTVAVHQGVRVDALTPDDDGVTIGGADRDGGRVSARARYVVGADGGGGYARAALGVDMLDYGFSENWLVCDFRKRRPLPGVPSFRQVCDPAQPVSIVTIGPDHHRFSFMLDPGATAAEVTDAASVWARVAAYLGPDDAELVRVANYVFRSRVADRWRCGRVLLAGDAAHEMPPFLAQGMCSGIRDSHNLAWKLDLVLGGRADPEILDTYQPEREPHVRFITERAIELGRVQTLRDPDAARQRDERLLAARREQRAPEKLRFPALGDGLVASGGAAAGAFFPQYPVRSAAGAQGRFDDVAGQGLRLLVADPGILDALSAAQVERFTQAGGRTVVLGDAAGAAGVDGGPTAVVDLEGRYAAWMREHGCAAVVVRPDWYVFGTAADDAELSALVDELAGALRPTAAAA
jgi:2-polyprenyl-6-methoxyphenol hydroxylase-like FAD-dependent oxidoreductase